MSENSAILGIRSADTAAEIDRVSCDAVRRWPEYSGINPVRDGFDYGLLTRFLLWDKVARAIRRQRGLEDSQFESGLLRTIHDFRDVPNEHSRRARPPHAEPFTSRMRRSLRSRLGSLQAKRPRIYIPFPSPRLSQLIPILHEAYHVLIPKVDLCVPGYDEVDSIYVDTGGAQETADAETATAVLNGIVSGLAAQTIELSSEDRSILILQLTRLAYGVARARRELASVKPDAILLHTDNHPPYIDFAMAARRQHIPAIMIQHGLDCERYVLDEAYASHIAVWGDSRKERYTRDSEYQAERIEIVGNPEYDDTMFPHELAEAGDAWLWVTRPHRPEKCYLPSRSVREGVDILEAFIDVLRVRPSARLVIKPHCCDYSEIYDDVIADSDMSDQISTCNDPLERCLSAANLVFTEDSTAGMDAMTRGKVLIHLHFCQTPPVVPFVDYKAAIPASNKTMLCEGIDVALDMDSSTLNTMFRGQRAFLRDHAGPCDSHARHRFRDFVASILQ